MTQEVQPLAWQKRTNLEEHQQFFSKINEIIANLAPTVDEAEAAIAQATQAVTAANAAIETANAASANADAASQQAQTAANTVAGYDTRMSAVESKNTQQDTAISALQTADGQNVKLTENQDITGIKTVPTEATGSRSQQIANSAKVGAELDNYAPMLRLTGNASIYGRKAFNAISTRNVNGQGDATSCLELFRFKPTSGQDHRFNFFRHLGYGVCLTFLRVQTSGATVAIIDGSKTPIGTSTGNITIGAGFTTDGWCIVYEKEESVCVFCTLLSAFTGSRFPVKESNIDMSNQCNIVDLTSLSGISEVTL